METRNACHPRDFRYYTTERLREDFLIQNLFVPGKLNLVYSDVDRVIAGAACPVEPLSLTASKEIGAEFFLARRELGIINVGASGAVIVDGIEYALDKTDGLFIGMGVREVTFRSIDPVNPAKFYLNSAPAHKAFPTVRIERRSIAPVKLGTLQQGNQRSIYKYIHPQGATSCQLVMGMTELEPGSMWNTMPCHTHARRMEVYFYFNLPADGVVFHLMGEPAETRHIVVRNEEAVISPSWSIHSGVGTVNYTFIWGMAGENQIFDDMDHVPMGELK